MGLVHGQIPPRYLKELPPRRLDLITQAILLFGDVASQVGWLLLAMGSVFFWTIATNSEARLLLEERNVEWQSKPGFVIAADPTGLVENGQQIWKYRYSFGLNGRRYFGESYSVGKKFDPRQTVFIRYDAGHPGRNYIIGLRRFAHSSKADWFLLVPLFGLLLLVLPLRENLRVVRLLKIGDFTRGRLVNKYPTGETIRKGGTVMPEFRYSFEFEYKGVKYLANCRTHETDKVEDEETEIVLFNRYEPTFNLVYDAVPNMPHINEEGKMAPLRGLKARVLFLPVFTVVFNGVYFVFS
ncbi:MAG TPA: hypothetical protein ENJ20_07950 [Bacteroidetes bacterium]|nr:hypothetical protein [Bacteroidota bacterium]